MKPAHRLLARALPPDVAEYVIGDLVERRVTGLRLWRETFVALWTLSDHASSGDNAVEAFLNDLRHAGRLLRRSPAFTLVSVLTLGLGIGATTAIFSVIHPVIIEPLPYAQPDRLAMVWERGADGSRDNVGFQTFRDLVTQSRTIETAAAVGSWFALIDASDGPERIDGDRVSWTYFRTLGVRPALGRDFTMEEDFPGRHLVVILSHGLWTRAFGGDSAIIGKSIPIGGTPMTVVGVMPAGFQNVMSPNAQIWRVLGYDDQPWACRTCHHLRMLARLEPGVTMEEGRADLDVIYGRLRAAYPTEYAGVGTSLVSVQREVTREFRPALLALTAAAVALLLIAIANVSSMLLARSVRRDEEFAVRTALGAGRGRLTRQLLTEGLLLAVLGGAAAIAVAAVTIPALVHQLPPEIPRLSEVRFSGAAFAVASILIFVATFVTGLIPGMRRQGADLATALRSGRRAAGGTRQLARSGLVVAEVALALMLLVGCGLLARTVTGLLDVNPGFRPANLLTLEISAVGAAYDSAYKVFAYQDRVREAVSRLPGVVSVAISNQVPLGGNVDRNGVHALDKVKGNPEESPSGDRYSVTPGFIETMGVTVTSGRQFTPREARDTASYVVMVSDALARELWPGESPIGKFVKLGGFSPESPNRRVIGTTANVRHTGLDATQLKQVYMPQRQWGPDNQAVLIVRTERDPGALASTVRRVVHEIDPTQPIVRVATMDQLIATSTAQRRLALVLFAAFGVTALLLAVAGIYGVLAGRVAERTREIGLRSALGATPRDILALVVGHGARLAATGLVLGTVGALALGRLLQSLLFGVGATDPPTIAAVVAFLAVVTVAACLIPAVRAVRVQPTEALRSD
ncbi:MAG TPA: ABC transporter permease [Gemmatimonadaceae bacterium]|nr:ABC transporter permease [Gemmatimonadaceae bacterium]